MSKRQRKFQDYFQPSSEEQAAFLEMERGIAAELESVVVEWFPFQHLGWIYLVQEGDGTVCYVGKGQRSSWLLRAAGRMGHSNETDRIHAWLEDQYRLGRRIYHRTLTWCTLDDLLAYEDHYIICALELGYDLLNDLKPHQVNALARAQSELRDAWPLRGLDLRLLQGAPPPLEARQARLF